MQAHIRISNQIKIELSELFDDQMAAKLLAVYENDFLSQEPEETEKDAKTLIESAMKMFPKATQDKAIKFIAVDMIKTLLNMYIESTQDKIDILKENTKKLESMGGTLNSLDN